MSRCKRDSHTHPKPPACPLWLSRLQRDTLGSRRCVVFKTPPPLYNSWRRGISVFSIFEAQRLISRTRTHWQSFAPPFTLPPHLPLGPGAPLGGRLDRELRKPFEGLGSKESARAPVTPEVFFNLRLPPRAQLSYRSCSNKQRPYSHAATALDRGVPCIDCLVPNFSGPGAPLGG